MPDANRSLAESLLALFAGREPAAAMYGDLTEMAAARGRLWFWAAYARTLLSLSWRPLAAFFAGAIIFAILYDTQFMGLWLMAITHPHLGSPFADATLQLWFLAPFAAIRYGLGDRVVQLAFAAYFASTGGLILGLWFSLPEVWMALVLLAALCIAVSTPWRTSFIPLALSCTVGAVIMESLDRVGYFDWAIPGFQRLFPVLPALFEMLAVSVVFSWLHRRLLRSRLTGVAHG